MRPLQWFLLASSLCIYALTAVVIANQGSNWPAVAIGDLLALNWRSQFDLDFLIHLVLLAIWVAWREGFGVKGYAFGFLSIVMGGMFTFPYLLYGVVVAKGDPIALLLGHHNTAKG